LWYSDTYNKEVHTEMDLFSLSMVMAVLNAMWRRKRIGTWMTLLQSTWIERALLQVMGMMNTVCIY